MLQFQPIAIALAIGLSAIGAGLGIGFASGHAYEAIARNPEAAPTIRINFILGLVFAESLGIYGLVIALMILFTLPAR
ncbi:MAG TPA: ATP synthase F0 subunit C [Ktedonosporobacter sp.]|nr:ATP synthase F0 subunit C [Ktedonosporobacter sp.]